MADDYGIEGLPAPEELDETPAKAKMIVDQSAQDQSKDATQVIGKEKP
mgnify:CR=1 FL=1